MVPANAEQDVGRLYAKMNHLQDHPPHWSAVDLKTGKWPKT
jgi:hypothetical protein